MGRQQRGSKFDIMQIFMWINVYIFGGISSLSVGWIKVLSQAGRGSKEGGHLHMQLLMTLLIYESQLIRFDWTY